MHRLPAQQGCAAEIEGLGVPQTTHRFELLQIVLASMHVLLAQHGCPAPPQGTQVPELVEVLLQPVPGSRQEPPGAELEQQGWPVPPHCLQT